MIINLLGDDIISQIVLQYGMNQHILRRGHSLSRGRSRLNYSMAHLILCEVSDDIIAQGFTQEAAEMLSGKKGGRYCMLEVDSDYKPPDDEMCTIFGVQMQQCRNYFSDWGVLLSNTTGAEVVLPPLEWGVGTELSVHVVYDMTSKPNRVDSFKVIK